MARIQSNEWRENISKSLKGRKVWNKGLTKDDPRVARNTSNPRTQFKKGMTPWNKGLKGIMKPWNKGISHTEETKRKIQETKAKRKHLYIKLVGELNPMFKKNRDIGYKQKHRIIKKSFLHIKNCQKCGSDNDLELSNISGNYLLELSDWQILCSSCHRKFDNAGINFKGKEPWRRIDK